MTLALLTATLLLADAPALTRDPGYSKEVMAAVRQAGRAGPDLEKTVRELAMKGDGSAYAALGEFLMDPRRPGGPDLAKGCDASQSAGQHATALHNLATCHFTGRGRPLDMAKARDLYARASALGLAKAACAYGNMLMLGTGGPKDVPAGLDLCRRAADAGEPDAQTDYGGYLLLGEHLPKDARLARRYLQSAAEAGQINAAFLLAQVYWNGDGVERSVDRAVRWWSVAHAGGRKEAAFFLGQARASEMFKRYTADTVSSRQIEDVHRWYAEAAANDPDPAKRGQAATMLANLEALLTGVRAKGR